jgi:hypothetical protein
LELSGSDAETCEGGNHLTALAIARTSHGKLAARKLRQLRQALDISLGDVEESSKD